MGESAPPRRRTRSRARRLRRALVVLVVLSTCMLAVVAGIVVAARAVTPDGLVRDRATECATPKTYATHTTIEIEDCVTRIVRADMERQGVLPALVSLQRAANRNPMLKGLCHLSLHVLGREQQRAGMDVTELDSPLERDANWNSICVGGFIHGYLQAMSEDSTPGELVRLAREWCTTLADQNREGCSHAVGHGLSRYFENDLRQSADACHGLPAEVRNDCLSGAIMELDFANGAITKRMRRQDDQLGPTTDVDCGVVKRDQRQWCRAFQLRGVALVTELRTIG